MLTFQTCIFSLFTYIWLVQTTLLFEYNTPQNCSIVRTKYFNVINLQCVECSNGTIASEDHLRCVCPPGFIQAANGTCQKCEEGYKVSDDGLFCIQCSTPGAETSVSQCPKCPLHHFEQRTISKEGMLTAKQCKKCPDHTKVSKNGDTCVPCTKTANTCECQANEMCQKVEGNEMLTMIEFERGSYWHSRYIARNIRSAVQGCSNADLQACQHLANMCVLQNYRTEQSSACTEFEKITKPNHYRGWTSHNGLSLTAPTLFYYNTEPSVELFRETAISGSFSFDTNRPNSFLEIILVQFTLNGTFLGMQPLSDSNLNLCSQRKDKHRFGAFYRIQCVIQLRHLLFHNSATAGGSNGGVETVFSDFYVVFLNEKGIKEMYAVPILNENLRRNGEFVNRLTPKKLSNSQWILTRRIYFVDSTSLNDFTKMDEQNLTVIRFPEKISIRIQIQPQKDGRIMPPYIRIRHGETRWNPSEQISMQFEISYFMDGSKVFQEIEIVLFVLAALSVVYAAVSAYSWGRRSGKMIIDGATIIKLILFECDILSDVFLSVILATAIFITYAYKAQQLPYYVVFNTEQENTLISYLLVAMVLKSISVLHRTAHLILTKTFFIDWERPHLSVKVNNTTPGSADISQSTVTTPPVIWRTYLVANEWNELQNYRKTSTGIQMIVMLALLQWLKLENWSAVAPGFYTEIPASYASSRLSRLAITSSIYLAVSIVQWMIHVIVIERLILDPFHNMIDLCSIANISILALTHPLHGYYIHGRSVHGQADTDMAEMNQYLHKERENLCGERGLESGSELQTYVVNLPKAFREQYDEASRPLDNGQQKQFNRLTNFDSSTKTANVEKIAKVHERLNRFLIEFIEHSNPKANYIIRDASLLEFLLDIEFVDTSQTGNFIRDKSEMAYSGVFMYGNEWIYLSFELLLFNSVDMLTESYPCSALITYTVSVVSRKLASLFFTNHLIKSSFVDQRFLM